MLCDKPGDNYEGIVVAPTVLGVKAKSGERVMIRYRYFFFPSLGMCGNSLSAFSETFELCG